MTFNGENIFNPFDGNISDICDTLCSEDEFNEVVITFKSTNKTKTFTEFSSNKNFINFLKSYFGGLVKCGGFIADDELISPGFMKRKMANLNKEFKTNSCTQVFQNKTLDECDPKNLVYSLNKECPTFVQSVSQLLFGSNIKRLNYKKIIRLGVVLGIAGISYKPQNCSLQKLNSVYLHHQGLNQAGFKLLSQYGLVVSTTTLMEVLDKCGENFGKYVEDTKKEIRENIILNLQEQINNYEANSSD